MKKEKKTPCGQCASRDTYMSYNGYDARIVCNSCSYEDYGYFAKKTLGELWTEDLLNSNVSELQARIEYLEREQQKLLAENLELLDIVHKLQEK